MFPEDDDKLMPLDISPGANMTRGTWAALLAAASLLFGAAAILEVFCR